MNAARLPSILIVLAFLLLSCSANSEPDFDKGRVKGFEAYQRGDYAEALREWSPLAEQGDEEIQVLLGSM